MVGYIRTRSIHYHLGQAESPVAESFPQKVCLGTALEVLRGAFRYSGPKPVAAYERLVTGSKGESVLEHLAGLLAQVPAAEKEPVMFELQASEREE